MKFTVIYRQFKRGILTRICLAACLFLLVLPQPSFGTTCEKIYSDTASRAEMLNRLFGPDRLNGVNKSKRRDIEKSLFQNSRPKFLEFWSQLTVLNEKQGFIGAQDAVRRIDRFHDALFEGHSRNEYGFAIVLELAKIMQRQLAPSMRDESYYVIFAGSFPNGKARLKESDIDAWISSALFRSDLDILNKQFSTADVEIRKYLGRPDKVISEDFVHLNDGLPGAPFMNYNPIAVLISGKHLQIAVYDAITNRRLIIPISGF